MVGGDTAGFRLTLIEAGRLVRCGTHIYKAELKTHDRITKGVEARRERVDISKTWKS